MRMLILPSGRLKTALPLLQSPLAMPAKGDWVEVVVD